MCIIPHVNEIMKESIAMGQHFSSGQTDRHKKKKRKTEQKVPLINLIGWVWNTNYNHDNHQQQQLISVLKQNTYF